ncbi:MAG: hypothetical protein IPH84_09750 [Bacteroidales bacterium]|nr:hypothetical protein [Bacteroidales bacterium]
MTNSGAHLSPNKQRQLLKKYLVLVIGKSDKVSTSVISDRVIIHGSNNKGCTYFTSSVPPISTPAPMPGLGWIANL